MCATFVFYITDDGHMVGRSMWEYIVCTKLNLVYLCAFVGSIIVCVSYTSLCNGTP